MLVGILLRCLKKDYGVTWDVVLAQVEFSYNDSINRSTSFSAFQIVYGTHPRGVLELRDVSQVARRSAQAKDFFVFMRELHQEVKNRLEKTNEKYKERVDKTRRDLQLKEVDMVMVDLRLKGCLREDIPSS